MKLMFKIIMILSYSMVLYFRQYEVKAQTKIPVQINDSLNLSAQTLKTTQPAFIQFEKKYFLDIVDSLILYTKQEHIIDYTDSNVPGITYIKSKKMNEYAYKYNIPSITQNRVKIIIRIGIDSGYIDNFYNSLNSKFKKEKGKVKGMAFLPELFISDVKKKNNTTIVLYLDRASRRKSGGSVDKSSNVEPIIEPTFRAASNAYPSTQTAQSLLQDIKIMITNNTTRLDGLSYEGYVKHEKNKKIPTISQLVYYRIYMLSGLKKMLK